MGGVGKDGYGRVGMEGLGLDFTRLGGMVSLSLPVL